MRKIILLALVLCLGLAACHVHTRGPGPYAHVVHTKFYYYPDAEVYFNPVTRVYVVWQSDAWVTVKTCPAIITSRTTYVVINDKVGKPWHRHTHFKKHHPAKHHKKSLHKKKHPGKGKGKKH